MLTFKSKILLIFCSMILFNSSYVNAIDSKLREAAKGSLVGDIFGGSVIGDALANENPILANLWTEEFLKFAGSVSMTLIEIKQKVNDIVKEASTKGIEYLVEYKLLSPLLDPLIQEIYYEIYQYIIRKELEEDIVQNLTVHPTLLAFLQPYFKTNLATVKFYTTKTGLGGKPATVDCNKVYLHQEWYPQFIVNQIKFGTFFRRESDGRITYGLSKTPEDINKGFLHELRHVDQCLRWGGRREYANVWMANLIATIGVDVLADPIGNINRCSTNSSCIHDGMPMEKEANDYALKIMAHFKNSGTGPVTTNIANGPQIPPTPLLVLTNKKGLTIGVKISDTIFISYDYDENNRIVAERQHNSSTVSPYWYNNFNANSSGLTSLPAGHMSIANDKLAIVTKNTGSETWKSVLGTRSYTPRENVVFRTEVETGDSSDGRYLVVGIVNSGGAQRRHAAYFEGDSLFVSTFDRGYKNKWLDTVTNNTSYIVEITTSSSGSTLYIYEKGRHRSTGFVDTRNYTDWSKVRTFIESKGYPGSPAAKMYLDYFVESSVKGKLVDDVIAPENDVVDFKAEYNYNPSGLLISKIDYFGKLISYLYDANGKVSKETRHDNIAKRTKWYQNFTTNGSGYWGFPNSSMSVKNGKLVVESQSSARTWKGLWGKRSYKYNDKMVFRTEVTTGSSTTSRYLMVGAEGDWGIGQYRRHTALFDGNGIYVNYYNNGYRNIRLGVAKNNTAYIVELVTENLGTKLYIYEKGKLKSSAYVDSRPYNDWGKMQSFIEAQNYPGANASKMYINVQSEAKSAGSLYGKYIIEKSINDVILNY